MNIDQLRGYILEEVLAYLLTTSGYYVLSNEDADDVDLVYLHNGLNVRGRGADHQVDVLGELAFTPAFSRPIRLFVEAKYRGARIGVEEVRAAVGILADLNTRYTRADVASQKPMHTYRFALFSASGFAEPATTYAVAHEITLVDLRAGAFASLLMRVRQSAIAINPVLPDGRITHVRPTALLRAVLREMLGTELGYRPEPDWAAIHSPAFVARVTARLPSAVPRAAAERFIGPIAEAAMDLVRGIVEEQPILVGLPQAPFLLAMRPRSISEFIDYVVQHGSHRVHLVAAEGPDSEVTLLASPEADPDRYELRFTLPDLMAQQVLDSTEPRRRLAAIKRTALAGITVTVTTRDGLRPVRLTYQPRQQSLQF